MQTLRFKIVLSIFAVTIAGTADAQDSTYTVKLANAYLKNIEADKIVTSWTRLMKGENGTDENNGSALPYNFKAGKIYTIAVVTSSEELEELSLSCVFQNGHATTDSPLGIPGEKTTRVKWVKVPGLGTITLDVKKTGNLFIYVRGSKLPADGVYYKLIISTL
jgi:hypothetical protein